MSPFYQNANFAVAIHDAQKDRLLRERKHSKEELEEIEHIRWCRYCILNHWKGADKMDFDNTGSGEPTRKDDVRRLHRCLRPFRELTGELEEFKEKDWERYCAILDAINDDELRRHYLEPCNA